MDRQLWVGYPNGSRVEDLTKTINRVMQVWSVRGFPETLPEQTPVWVIYNGSGSQHEQIGVARELAYIDDTTVRGVLTVRQEYADGDYGVYFEALDDKYYTVIVLSRMVKHDSKLHCQSIHRV